VPFIERIRARKAEGAKPVDPWRLRRERVRGATGFDNLERISSQRLMDLLEVEQRKRTTAAYRHLCKVMVSLGWSPVRVRDFNGRGFKETVRGYVRGASAVY
jgi:hypothetical protein